MKNEGTIRKRSPLLFFVALILSAAICLTGCTSAFKPDSVVKAAKNLGMNPIGLAEFEARHESGSFRDEYYLENGKLKPAYFVAKDGNEAKYVHSKYLRYDDNDIVALDGLVSCESDSLDVCLMTSISKESADKLYNEWSEFNKEDGPVVSTGKKSGYIYTIGYITTQGDTERKTCFGIYKKDKAVLLLYAAADTAEERQNIDSFCKELGVLSPVDMMK